MRTPLLTSRLLTPLLLLSQVFPIGWLCGVWLCGAVCGDCAAPEQSRAQARAACACCGTAGGDDSQACANDDSCCPAEPVEAACNGCAGDGTAHEGCVCVFCPGDDQQTPQRPVPDSRPLFDLVLANAPKPSWHPALAGLPVGVEAPLVDSAGRLTTAECGLVRAWLCCWTT